MRLTVVAVGKLRDAELRAVTDDYYRRVRRYVPLDEVEVKTGEAITRALPKEALVVACEVEGRALSSEAFARQLEAWGSRNKGAIAFVVGGAEGIPRAVSERTDVALSLSAMTLPHRLARVVLAEQLYRAMTILRGEPYARQ